MREGEGWQRYLVREMTSVLQIKKEIRWRGKNKENAKQRRVGAKGGTTEMIEKKDAGVEE